MNCSAELRKWILKLFFYVNELESAIAEHPARLKLSTSINWHSHCRIKEYMIRKLKSGQYRLYSRKKDLKTNKRRNLGTFGTLQAARQHEREVQYFKRH